MIDFTFFAILIAHLVFSFFVQLHITRSILLSKERKWINSILLWLVPFLWGLLTLVLTKGHGNKVILKDDRKPDPVNHNTTGITST